ncbi:hypothetical protein OGAPHI_002218 [Ogataea philodendri]|uniref:Uncharacterized protein n=1 Tax=Ogataea philodendri TaxID=1378263 RepID=A0A9P8T7H2_9ASCO|nr:uncharacterized protein OGAPHI_002218 [Ogataea philodendri]KAH3668464.1 hypothetical protein OGAPHI_002218 [Ogataea philodendri]
MDIGKYSIGILRVGQQRLSIEAPTPVTWSVNTFDLASTDIGRNPRPVLDDHRFRYVLRETSSKIGSLVSLERSPNSKINDVIPAVHCSLWRFLGTFCGPYLRFVRGKGTPDLFSNARTSRLPMSYANLSKKPS